jgi:hypothetical protein
MSIFNPTLKFVRSTKRTYLLLGEGLPRFTRKMNDRGAHYLSGAG